jgi:hypothetical protein
MWRRPISSPRAPPRQPPEPDEAPDLQPASAAEAPPKANEAPPDSTRPVPPGIRCRVSALGAVAGHGVRPDGRRADFWPSGSVGYFSEAAVRKHPHLLVPEE